MERRHSGIKLRQLQYFLAVAEHLHFSKAADRVAATQPTLSHQIGQMEKHLNTVLFDRVGKTIRLTEAGAVLQEYAVRALKELEAGCVALDELEGLQRGSLRIGVIQSFSRTLLPSILGPFMREFPGIAMRVEELTASAIEEKLSAGDLDLGIAFESLALDDTEAEPLLQEPLILIVARDHRFAGRREVAMRELHDEPMALLATEFSTRRLIDRYLADVGAAPRVVCETNSIEVMLGAVSETALSTMIPEQAIRPSEHPHLCAVSLCDPVPVRTSALLWPKYSFRTAAARAFAALIRKRFSASDHGEGATG